MAFLGQFMGSKARIMPKECLVSIKQAKSDSFKSCLNEFNKQSMEVVRIFDDAALMVVLSGLRPRSKFWWFVYEDKPQTYHEFVTELRII